MRLISFWNNTELAKELIQVRKAQILKGVILNTHDGNFWFHALPGPVLHY